MSKIQHIFREARRFISGTLLSKCFGVSRDISFAYAFGATSAIASFMVAFRLAHFFRRFIGESGLSVAFIPHFEKRAAISEKEGALFFRDLAIFFSIFLLVLVVFLSCAFFGASQFLGSESSWGFIAHLSSILCVSLFFIGLYALNQAFLQTAGVFFVPSSAPIGFNICAILGALFAKKQAVFQPYSFLALSITFGFLVQWLWTLPATLKIFIPRVRGALFKHITYRRLRESDLTRSAGLGLLGIAAVQMNSIIDGIFAKLIEPSGPAFLWYAVRIYQLPLSLFAVSMASALLPSLSKVAKMQPLFDEYLLGVIRKALVFMIPCTVAIATIGPSGIELLYGRGHFVELNALKTYYCLMGYGLGLIGSCLVIVLAQAFYAKGDYMTPSKAAITSVVANLLLNLFFIYVLQLGSSGIALATGLSTSLNAIILQRALSAKGIMENAIAPSSLIVKLSLASAIAGLCSIIFGAYHRDSLFASLTGQIPFVYLPSFKAQVLAFTVRATLFAGVFLTSAYLLKISEVRSLQKEL